MPPATSPTRRAAVAEREPELRTAPVPTVRERLAADAEHLSKTYPAGGRSRAGRLRAVDDVSFAVRPGESLGLVGESGSGKSTVARLLLGLADRDGGELRFEGHELPVGRARRRVARGASSWCSRIRATR